MKNKREVSSSNSHHRSLSFLEKAQEKSGAQGLSNSRQAKTLSNLKSINPASNVKLVKSSHKLADVVSFRQTVLSAKGIEYVKGQRCIDMFDDFMSFNSFKISDR